MGAGLRTVGDMTRSRTLITLLGAFIAVAGLTACSSKQEAKTVNTDRSGLSVLDPAITDLLPIGPHLMELTMTAPGGSTLKVSGYIDLGKASDGSQCRTDLQVEQVIKGDNPSDTTLTIRRDSDVTWHRLDRTTTKTVTDVKGLWVDAVDYDAIRPALIFAPLFVTDGMPVTENGGSSICTLRLLDQTAAYDPTTNKVVYDMKVVAQYMKTAFEMYTDHFLRAGGAKDADVAKYLPQLVERGIPDYSSMLADLHLSISRGDDSTVFTQNFDVEGFTLTAEFKPTAARSIEPVTGVDSFYSRLSKDAVHQKMVGELLQKGLSAWENGSKTDPAASGSSAAPQPSPSK